MAHQGITIEILRLICRLSQVALAADGLHDLLVKPLTEPVGVIPLHTALLATEGAAIGVLL
jgi:hypothetical protein